MKQRKLPNAFAFSADAFPGDRVGSRSSLQPRLLHCRGLYLGTCHATQERQHSNSNRACNIIPSGFFLKVKVALFPKRSQVPVKRRREHSTACQHTHSKRSDPLSVSSTEVSLRPASSRLFSKRLLFGAGENLGVYLVLGQPISSLSFLSFSARETFPDKQPRC